MAMINGCTWAYDTLESKLSLTDESGIDGTNDQNTKLVDKPPALNYISSAVPSCDIH